MAHAEKTKVDRIAGWRRRGGDELSFRARPAGEREIVGIKQRAQARTRSVTLKISNWTGRQLRPIPAKVKPQPQRLRVTKGYSGESRAERRHNAGGISMRQGVVRGWRFSTGRTHAGRSDMGADERGLEALASGADPRKVENAKAPAGNRGLANTNTN